MANDKTNPITAEDFDALERAAHDERNTIASTVTDAGIRHLILVLADLRECLWPDGDCNAEWDSETIECVAHTVSFLRPDDVTVSEEG